MLFKNTLIKIKKSFGRYISLFIIVMVGIGFFLGLNQSSPDIINSVDKYYKTHDLMDFKIVSTMGLTDNDVKAIKSLKGVKNVVPSYSLDVLDRSKAIKIQEIENSINNVKLVKGRMPRTYKECIADSKKYKVGDKIIISSPVGGKLKNTKFTVVGTVQSPLYMDTDYGNTIIGDGKLYSFIFVNKDNFNMSAYTEIYITANGTNNVKSYSKKYDDISKKINNELVKLKPERAKWYIYDRDSVVGYSNLKSGTDTITSVAAVFPSFFILIVMLMTSNTMARMITEERGELGILTSLGFKDTSIISTYLFYVLSATVLGTMTGFLIFTSVIPNIIYATFNKFILPPLLIQYNVISLLIALATAVALMAAVTVFFCNKALKQKPAALMCPVPPKNGQRILFEKIGFIWKHISFNGKVTMRNIFRYKQRVFMTIVGVAGCTALLVTGFGLRDSINGVAERQYGEIFKYNTLITLNNETQSPSSNLESLLTKEKVGDPLLIKQATFQAGSDDKLLSTYLVVPENEGLFKKYFNLTGEFTQDAIKLNNGGVVITQKLAEILKIGKGDAIKIKDTDNNSYSLRVSDVAENYMQNYIYISKSLYSKVFGRDASYNMIVSNYSNDKTVLARHLLGTNSIVNVTFKDDILQQAADGSKSLNNVVVLLVAIAAILVIIVLYNLTSINMSERKREIATLKVLGFTDKETNQYIYREAFLLALISIGVGLVLGVPLHRFVISAIESDEDVYLKNIHFASFIWSSLIIILVSMVMQVVTYFKMKKINMIESLKSVE